MLTQPARGAGHSAFVDPAGSGHVLVSDMGADTVTRCSCAPAHLQTLVPPPPPDCKKPLLSAAHPLAPAHTRCRTSRGSRRHLVRQHRHALQPHARSPPRARAAFALARRRAPPRCRSYKVNGGALKETWCVPQPMRASRPPPPCIPPAPHRPTPPPPALLDRRPSHPRPPPALLHIPAASTPPPRSLPSRPHPPAHPTIASLTNVGPGFG